MRVIYKMISSVIVFITLLVAAIHTKPHYNMLVVDITWNVSTPHNIETEWHSTRISRGVDAVSGFADFKEDINTDNVISSFIVNYSSNGVSYTLSPFRYPPTVFTKGLNTPYKQYLMDSLVECCENPIYIEDEFVQPLTKRHMVCTNCLLNIDNFPSHLRLGYYEVLITLEGELGLNLRMLLLAENE